MLANFQPWHRYKKVLSMRYKNKSKLVFKISLKSYYDFTAVIKLQCACALVHMYSVIRTMQILLFLFERF